MSPRYRSGLTVAGWTLALASAAWLAGAGLAQPAGTQAPPPPANAGEGPGEREIPASSVVPGTTAGKLLQVRVSHLTPGQVALNPNIENPVANDPGAVERGMQNFIHFNCVGCHAANGGGGMGPSLSDAKWIYGGTPANIYLTIVQGRPNGMPAWGGTLPDQIVWELVAYIQSISKPPPQGKFGKTTSRTLPKIEQVPAGMIQTTRPWDYTEPFSNGQRPGSQYGTTPGGSARNPEASSGGAK